MEPRQTERMQEPALSKQKEVITLFFHDDLCLQDGVVKGKVGHGNLHLRWKASHMSRVGGGATCPLTSVPARGKGHIVSPKRVGTVREDAGR